MTSAASKPGTILLVEDDPGIRRVLAMSLRRHGFEVVEAANGDAALRAIENGHTLTVMVTDCNIPGVSVTELAAAAARRVPPLKTILTSGYALEALRRRVNLPEGLPFLMKPFTAKDLVSLLPAE